jgi:hypothetical protein
LVTLKGVKKAHWPCAKTPSRKITEVMKLVTIIMMLLALTTSAAAIECRTAKPAGAPEWWSWREVDGRRCWYAGRPGMDKTKLHWAQPASTAAAAPADAGPPPPPVVTNPPPAIEPVTVRRPKPIVVSVQTAPTATAPPAPGFDIRRLFIAALMGTIALCLLLLAAKLTRHAIVREDPDETGPNFRPVSRK